MAEKCIGRLDIEGYGSIYCGRRPRHAGPHRGTIMGVASGKTKPTGISATIEWHFDGRALRNQPGRQDETTTERERCAKVVEDFAKAYPPNVFLEPPPGEHGKTVDGCSARALREILPAVADKVRESEE